MGDYFTKHHPPSNNNIKIPIYPVNEIQRVKINILRVCVNMTQKYGHKEQNTVRN